MQELRIWTLLLPALKIARYAKVKNWNQDEKMPKIPRPREFLLISHLHYSFGRELPSRLTKLKQTG